MLTPDYLQRFNDALVDVINAERGKRNLSLRAMSTLIGVSQQYLAVRLGDTGNSRTGKRVEITISDLELIGEGFSVDPADLLDRAREEAMNPEQPWTPHAIAALEAFADLDKLDDEVARRRAMSEAPATTDELTQRRLRLADLEGDDDVDQAATKQRKPLPMEHEDDGGDDL